eukprot:3437514-Amphidinium_carterae.1
MLAPGGSAALAGAAAAGTYMGPRPVGIGPRNHESMPQRTKTQHVQSICRCQSRKLKHQPPQLQQPLHPMAHPPWPASGTTTSSLTS